MRTSTVTLALCGDAMLGRGVDQILPHPGDPALEEFYVRDARGYVALAEAANGPIPRPVDFAWPWGDALEVLEEAAPDVRIVNLETSVTRADTFAPGKGIHYRMRPDNLPCLRAVRPDACVLANNHVLDFGPKGLRDTLDSLAAAGLRVAGAGHGAAEAREPAAVDLGGGGRVLVLSFGMPSAGVPPAWAAGADRPGIHVVSGRADECADVTQWVRRVKRPGDIVVASVHWGSNWGYDVANGAELAHALIDAGVDVVHGHSSHHPRAIEVYRDRLVLYGCGDFVNDYEGIRGHEEYRDELRLLYLATVQSGSEPGSEPHAGRLSALRMVPLRSRRMRLRHASRQDARWLMERLTEVSRPLGCGVSSEDDALVLRRA